MFFGVKNVSWRKKTFSGKKCFFAVKNVWRKKIGSRNIGHYNILYQKCIKTSK